MEVHAIIKWGGHTKIPTIAHRPSAGNDVLGESVGHKIYRCMDTISGRAFVYKTVSKNPDIARERALRTFMNDAAILYGLHHRHIISLIATCGYDDDTELGIVLLKVIDQPPGNLATLLEDCHRTPRNLQFPAVSMMLNYAFGCLADGLQYMHQSVFFRKDIKPRNILICAGTILLTDFGVGIELGHTEVTTEQTCSAPEVRNGEPRSPASDVYSLGCIFLCVTNALFANRPAMALSAQAFQQHPDVGKVPCEHVDVGGTFCFRCWLTRLISTMLVADPSARATALEVRNALFDGTDLYHPGLVRANLGPSSLFFCPGCKGDVGATHIHREPDERP